MKVNEFFKNEENVKYLKTVSKNMYKNSVLVYYMEEEDYNQEQMINMVKKLKFYKDDRSKLKTYIIMCVKNRHNELYNYMVSSRRRLNNPLYLHYLDDKNEKESDSHNIIPSKDDDNTIEFILNDYSKVLAKDEIELLRYKYYGLSGKEIADKMNTNYKHVEYKMRVIRKKLNNISGLSN